MDQCSYFFSQAQQYSVVILGKTLPCKQQIIIILNRTPSHLTLSVLMLLRLNIPNVVLVAFFFLAFAAVCNERAASVACASSLVPLLGISVEHVKENKCCHQTLM